MSSQNLIKKTATDAEFAVTLEAKDIAPHKTHVLEHLKRGVKVAGFRPGKAPDNIAEREIGDQKVQAEVLQDIITHSYAEAVKALQLETIADPEIHLEKFVPYSELNYRAIVALAPEVKLPDLKKLGVKPEQAEVNDQEIDEAVEHLRKSAATRTPVTRAAKTGDEAVLDFVGTRNGAPVAGAQAEKHRLMLGEGQFIPGFEDNVVGLKPGGEKDFEVTFPKDYQPADLAGAKVTFHVKLHELNELKVPEVNDAFAKQLGPFQDIKQLRTDVKQHLEQGKTEQQEQKFRDAVVDAVLAKTILPLSDKIVNAQIDAMRQQINHELQHNGLDEAKYLEINHKTKAEFEQELRTEAERRVKLALILRRVVGEQKLTVSPPEVDAKLTVLKMQYSDPQAQEELNKPEFAADLQQRLLMDKAIDYLVAQAKGATAAKDTKGDKNAKS